MSTFVKNADVRQEEFDWGIVGWRCAPENTGSRAAELQVVIGPSLGEGSGYGLVDVSGEEPWASLR